jgi:Holliday junction resolvase RusA-like endonuclease
MIVSEFKAFASGHPKGQPRPRAFNRNGRTAVYDPGTAEGWKGQVASACKALEGNQHDGPLQVELSFMMPRPKEHFLKRGLRPNAPRWFTGKPDADNLAKAVLDALTQIGAWKDDSLVTVLIANKEYAENPGCFITIRPLP